MIPPVSEVPLHSEQSPSSSQSQSFPPRIPSLDVILGVAVLGALFISILIFGGFSSNDQTALLLKSKGLNYRLFGKMDLLLNEKMKTLIAIVFGAGMIIFMSRDNEKGQAGNADLLMRRQMWLILFGLINAIVFLWTGDILFHLGIMGVLLFPFVRFSQRSLFIASAVALIIFCGKNYWNYADDKKAYRKYKAVVVVEGKIKKDSADNAKKDSILKAEKKDTLSKASAKDTLTKEQKTDKSAWEGKIAGMKYDPKKDDDEKKSMRKVSYGKLWNHLLPRSQVREAQWTYQFGLWDFGAMILLGMALFKSGFFNARLSRSKYLMIALSGITIGLLLGWFRLHNNQVTLQDYAKYIDKHWIPYNLFFPIEMVTMSLGYASLLLFFIGTGPLNRLWRGFAAAGRLALTNYLLQSIICTILFTGFGMGYYGRLSQPKLYIIAAEICLVQIVFSVLWLRYFHYGPAEWLLRCLVHKRWVPNKISNQSVGTSSATIAS